MVFIAGNLGDRRGELHGADLAFDLAAQSVREGKELTGGERGEVAPGKFGFDLLELLAQGVDAVIEPGEPFFLEVLQKDGALVLDFKLEFAAPVDERRLGYSKILGDASEAPTLSAEEHETLLFIGFCHSAAHLSTGS